jgi:hypothetical protein
VETNLTPYEKKNKVLTWNAFLVLVFLFIGSFGGMATRMCFYFAGCLQKNIYERSNKNCIHQVATLYAGNFDSNTAFMNQIYCTSGKYIPVTQNNCKNNERNKMTKR